MIIAELRGWQDEKGNSPFRDGLGHRFFAMDFASADLASATAGSEFIAELMPKLPLYLDLLPDDAANCVGKAHSVSAIAMKMPVDEGFRQGGYVDIFDGGPQLAARRDTISTVRKTRFVRLGEIAKHREEVGLIAKPQLDDFRMVASGEGATLDEMASVLALSSQDVAAVCFD
ncbi:arginine N-succinyltransferase [Qipengyuania sp.]|uniref:arginine N-succinyltransferase n=1 Tax=Qipengyuania sp. TaxID=2004515 RepID=UPI003AF9F5C6